MQIRSDGPRRRPPRTTPAGPGRTPRSRTGLRASAPTSAVSPPARSSISQRVAARLPTRLGLTRRALAMITVGIVLVLSYANSLRIFVGQQHDLGVAQQQIRERSARIEQLEDELRRWEDPAYVRIQARERLGWVLPGEKGYRVIGADGTPLGGGVIIESEETLPVGEHAPMWFDRLWGSIQTADAPARRLGG